MPAAFSPEPVWPELHVSSREEVTTTYLLTVHMVRQTMGSFGLRVGRIGIDGGGGALKLRGGA